MGDIVKTLFKFCVTCILTLTILINIKSNTKFKDKFYQIVYENNISFAHINFLYKKYFGDLIPFNPVPYSEPVFNETITYDNKKEYLDGVSLNVSDDYLVPVIVSGLVVFTGEKEGYGNVVIIEQEDGVDCWYGNLENINVDLYDYVEKGSLLGNVSNELYLVYKNKGEIISYEKYLP